MTLRRYVPAAVLAAVLALVAVAGLLAWRQYDNARLVATSEVQARVALAAGDAEAYFTGDIATLKAVARSRVVIDSDRVEMLAYFRRVAAADASAFPGGVSWIDAKGISRVTSAQATLAAPVDVSDRSYYKAVIATNRPFVSGGIVSRRNGHHVVVIAVPTHDATGAISGVLTGALVLNIGANTKPAPALGFSGLSLIDRAGQSILAGFARPQNRALLARIQAHPSGKLSDTRGLDGGSGRVVIWASSPTAGWSVVIDRPGSSVFATARHALMLDLVLIGGLALIVLALLVWLAQRARREQRRQSAQLAREHDIAVRLQRSMLPAALPRVDGVELASRYRAGAAGVEVGGDWYDVVARADGFMHAIVGDVAGRGIDAATLMGQLSMGFHAYAYDHGSPAEVLRRMVRLVPAGAMATAVCLTLDPYTGDLSYASAGHPPAVALDGAGAVTLLDVGGAPPLGYVEADRLADSHVQLGVSTTVVAYTDGLVERRTASIDVGIARLSAALADGAALAVDELAGRILDEVGDPSGADEDDIALLVIRLVGVPRRLDVELLAEPAMLGPLRRRLRRWLVLRGLAEQEVEDAILAINEACTNSIEHGYGRGDGPIRLTVTHATRLLEIVVHDRGRWRPPETDDPTRGRGIPIMQRVMRSADVASDATGTTVTMVLVLAR
jgi:serine phosphatase RsbU (regulator of sigma subunit)/anti-sigma regulatory factor (Ser/Thr protein kinase)